MSRVRYRTTPDRTGWALATGAGACGIGAMLVALGSGPGATGPVAALLAGAMLGAVAVGIGAVVWRLLGRRGPLAAGVTGAGVAAALAVIAILLSSDVLDAARWTSALATGAVAAFLGGLAALAMWLVAYRPA